MVRTVVKVVVVVILIFFLVKRFFGCRDDGGSRLASHVRHRTSAPPQWKLRKLPCQLPLVYQPLTLPPSLLPMAPAVSWLHLAILSGCSAACNGFFAKLTTGNSALTHSVIGSVSHFFGASDEVKWVGWAVRGVCFSTTHKLGVCIYY